MTVPEPDWRALERQFPHGWVAFLERRHLNGEAVNVTPKSLVLEADPDVLFVELWEDAPPFEPNFRTGTFTLIEDNADIITCGRLRQEEEKKKKLPEPPLSTVFSSRRTRLC